MSGMCHKTRGGSILRTQGSETLSPAKVSVMKKVAEANGTRRLGKERNPFTQHPACRELSPVHDDVHVAAVPLEAGAQQDLITSGEAHLHGVVGYHLGVGLQHGL